MHHGSFTDWRSHDTGHRLWPAPLLGAIAVGIAAGAFSLTPAGRTLETRYGLWGLFQLRHVIAPPRIPSEVVIIAMRRDTGERISLRRRRAGETPCADLGVDRQPFPADYERLGEVPERWGRCHYVELLKRLAPAQPRVVAFDVVFRPRSDLPGSEDRALALAMRQAGNVVIAQRLAVKRAPAELREDGVHATHMLGEALGPENSDSNRQDAPVELSHVISESALGAAPMPVPWDSRERMYAFWTFKDSGWVTPSLSALLLQAYALDAYPDLIDFLRQHAPATADRLLADLGPVVPRSGLQSHTLLLRGSLWEEVGHLERIRAGRAKRASALPPERERLLRALLSLYTRPNQRLLNFYGPPGTMRTLDIAEVLAIPVSEMSADRLALRDKVVIVGYAEEMEWDQREKFATVFDRGSQRMSGVEIVATGFANLLNGDDLAVASATVRFLSAFAVSTIAAVAIYVASTGTAVLIVATVMCTMVLLAFGLFSSHSLWLSVFLPLGAAAPVGALYAYGLKLRDYRYDRDRLKQIVKKFVPPSVVETLVSNVQHLGSVRETMHAACVMTDVEGFTALSSRLAPGQVHSLLQEYFAAIFGSVAKYGGFVSDLKGDSILAVWTDRDTDRAQCERVCRACLDLQDQVEQFNRDHPDSPMPTRIGINYGLVSLGPVGAGEHYEYRAVGDTVNTASRVEQLSKELGTYLLATAPVVEGLKGLLTRDLGDFFLRGRRGPSRIFEILSTVEQTQPDQVALCTDFGKALKAYEAGQFDEARTLFNAILRQFPGDGPSEYYSRIIQRVG